MPVSINFVSVRQKQLKVRQEKDKPLLKKSLIVLAVIVFLAGLVLSGHLYVGFETNRVLANQDKVKAAIADHKETENQFALFFQKLKVLTQLFGERQNKQAALAYFRNLFGAEVMVTGLSYNETDQQLTFSILSPSVFSLEKVFDTLKSEAVQNQYPGVTRSNLIRADNGSYSMQIVVNLQPNQSEKTQP